MKQNIWAAVPHLTQEFNRVLMEEWLAKIIEENLLKVGELIYDLEHDLEREYVRAVLSVVFVKIEVDYGTRRAPQITV
jgi:hypothetical protein